ncbi:hypothetical protein NHX12_008163 [Muraenolepis orangiensis]|uniref:Uncharacterized protein n=1 Tax=Muraenolepis orangiensis TaxID=630683 RepID=A0A9Q0DJ94_9TELE|nr:hypothetical protein NHX12_008163 [Muraenolepis orangiensis]
MALSGAERAMWSTTCQRFSLGQPCFPPPKFDLDVDRWGRFGPDLGGWGGGVVALTRHADIPCSGLAGFLRTACPSGQDPSACACERHTTPRSLDRPSSL